MPAVSLSQSSQPTASTSLPRQLYPKQPSNGYQFKTSVPKMPYQLPLHLLVVGQQLTLAVRKRKS
eukprot:3187077-Amphidinium_carterae.1